MTDWALDQLGDDDGAVPGDFDFLVGSYTVMTYRVHALGSDRGNPADLLWRVGTQMDTFLVDHLRTHANCARAYCNGHVAVGGHLFFLVSREPRRGWTKTSLQQVLQRSYSLTPR